VRLKEPTFFVKKYQAGYCLASLAEYICIKTFVQQMIVKNEQRTGLSNS
jgi:hypothetical protein